MAPHAPAQLQMPIDRHRPIDCVAQRPQVQSASHTCPAVPIPQFSQHASGSPQEFSVSNAEAAIKEFLSAQQRDALVAANARVQSLVGGFRVRLRQRKPSCPQRSEDDVTRTNSTPRRVANEAGTGARGRGGAGKVSKRKKGMSASDALKAMQKIVKCRMQKPRQSRSSAFYKVYPVLFGH